MLKTTKRAHLRLVINNELPARDSRDPSLPTRRRRLKVRGELLDMTDPRIFDLASSDLLDRPLRNSTAGGNLTPAPLRGLEVRQNGFVHGRHGGDSNPVFGFMQPSNGVSLSIGSQSMAGRPPKASVPTSEIGQTFAENVAALLPVTFPEALNETAQIKALGKASGVGRETIRHAIRGGRSPSLDAVASIARGLGVTINDLLMKGFGTQRAAYIRSQARQEPAAIPTRRRPVAAT